jgi:hypothetical protein
MKTPVEQPSEEIKMKMLEFFMNTSVLRILKEEQSNKNSNIA